jgi:8-oxo-dGTP pyrophosphatase MutT (NUDIX family)
MRRGIKFRETSAGGLVFRGGEVLLLQRRTGEWVLPKGHIEERESKAEAATREVQEETGLIVEALEPLGTTQYRFTNESGSLVHKTVHWFLMEWRGGDLAVEPLFRQARFAPPEEALRLLTFANDRALVNRALKKHFAER